MATQLPKLAASAGIHGFKQLINSHMHCTTNCLQVLLGDMLCSLEGRKNSSDLKQLLAQKHKQKTDSKITMSQ